jgi:hypothetical protein
VPLVERWNGRGWRVEPTPRLAAAALAAVSSSASDACLAVGNRGVPGRTLAERWNGRGWSVQLTPNPVGPPGSVLTGVSCTSATACTTLGLFYGGPISPDRAFAEQWDGRVWSIQAMHSPTGAAISLVAGVSCTPGGQCAAVGFYAADPHAHRSILAERWNGQRWLIQRSPDPQGAKSSELNGVSCSSPAACIAVGDYNTRTQALTLVDRWNGTHWMIQTISS